MFDIWHKIAEKGAVAVPLKAAALSPLGWLRSVKSFPIWFQTDAVIVMCTQTLSSFVNRRS